MATIGELAVNVVAKTQKFRRDMKDSETTLGKFTKAAKRTVLAVTAIGTAIAAVQLQRFNQFLTMADRLGKSATALGITAAQLQVFQVAAERSGIGTEVLTKSIARLNSIVGDTAAGRAGLRYEELFDSLGLSAERLSRMDAAEQFEAVTAAMNNLPDGQRLATSFAFFGRGGGAEVVRLAGANFAAYREELERLGIAISETDSEAIQEFNDSLDRILTKFKSGQQKLFVDITPPLLAALDRIEIILGLQDDPNANLALPKPTTLEGSLASLGVGRQPGEAEFARSGVVNPLRAVFREFFAEQGARGADQQAFNQLPEQMRQLIAIETEQLRSMNQPPLEIAE